MRRIINSINWEVFWAAIYGLGVILALLAVANEKQLMRLFQ